MTIPSRVRPILTLMLAAASLLCAQPARARPFTAEDLVRTDRLTALAASPDGRLVAYNVRSTPPGATRPINALWIGPIDGASRLPRPLVSGLQTATQPRWSPDGRLVYFLAPSAGLRQVWRAQADGAGSAVQVTRLPLDIQWFKLSPDGAVLVASIDVFPDCPTLACTRERLDAAVGRSANIVYRDVGVRFYDEWQDERRSGLFAVPMDGGAAIPLTMGLRSDIPDRPTGDDAAFTFSPDGRWVVFAAAASGVSNSESPAQDLYRAPIDGSAPPERLGYAEGGSAYGPAFSPDGRHLAYLHDRVAKSDGMTATIKVRPAGGGPARTLDTTLDRSPLRIAWSRDGASVYAIAEDAGQQRLYAFDAAGGPARPLTGDGSVEDLEAIPGGVVYLRSDFASPAQAYALGRGAPRRLTRVGERQLAGVDMAPFHSFTFKGWNGDEVQGFVVEPARRKSGQKHPVVFVIHGGPHGAYDNAWSVLRNPQIWAGRGYATVFINFHGSTGFGEDFSQSVHGHWGDRPLEDLQKGWAAALERFAWLDGERACALGSSYGGYLVNWMAGVWNAPWRCFVSHAGVFDVRAGGLSGDLVWYKDLQLGGSPIDQPEAFERFNPRNHVARWKKPILFTHGGRDLRVTVNESVSGHIAAQRLGIPSELLYMPDANHSITRPQDTLDWYAAVNAWLDRWTGPVGAAQAPRAR